MHTFRHYSPRSVDSVIDCTDPLGIWYKPRRSGCLWFASGRAWPDLVAREEMRFDCSVEHDVTFNRLGFIYWITADTIESFTNRFGSLNEYGDMMIDWDSVRGAGYHGVHIDGGALASGFSWTSSWDIPSGVIWCGSNVSITQSGSR